MHAGTYPEFIGVLAFPSPANYRQQKPDRQGMPYDGRRTCHWSVRARTLRLSAALSGKGNHRLPPLICESHLSVITLSLYLVKKEGNRLQPSDLLTYRDETCGPKCQPGQLHELSCVVLENDFRHAGYNICSATRYCKSL